MIGRLQALRRRHKSLDQRIEHEQSRPKPNGVYLATLKKTRLILRDRIAHVERLLSSENRTRPAKNRVPLPGFLTNVPLPHK